MTPARLAARKDAPPELLRNHALVVVTSGQSPLDACALDRGTLRTSSTR